MARSFKYAIVGPYKVVVDNSAVVGIDAIFYKQDGAKKEYFYEILIAGGERLSVEGFDTLKEARTSREEFMEEELLMDLEEEETTVTSSRKTLQEIWDSEKEALLQAEKDALKSDPKLISLVGKVEEELREEQNNLTEPVEVHD